MKTFNTVIPGDYVTFTDWGATLVMKILTVNRGSCRVLCLDGVKRYIYHSNFIKVQLDPIEKLLYFGDE